LPAPEPAPGRRRLPAGGPGAVARLGLLDDGSDLVQVRRARGEPRAQVREGAPGAEEQLEDVRLHGRPAGRVLLGEREVAAREHELVAARWRQRRGALGAALRRRRRRRRLRRREPRRRH